MIDVALAIEAILPAAEYFGTTIENTKKCYDDLNWQDSRPKPTWKKLEDVWVILEPELKAKAETKASQRQAILTRLGITEEEARILLGGN